jgi:hypothetical protein
VAVHVDDDCIDVDGALLGVYLRQPLPRRFLWPASPALQAGIG